jgi:hypothetical protein
MKLMRYLCLLVLLKLILVRELSLKDSKVMMTYLRNEKLCKDHAAVRFFLRKFYGADESNNRGHGMLSVALELARDKYLVK